jgi:hypothetical protein
MDITILKREWEDVLGWIVPADILSESEKSEGSKNKDLIPQFVIDGPTNLEDAYNAYEHFYLKPIKEFLKSPGQFYSFYVTSRKIPDWFLKTQCRVKDIGVIEGRDKQYVVGALIQLYFRFAHVDPDTLSDEARQNYDKVKEEYTKAKSFLSRIPSAIQGSMDFKKFKHIKTDTIPYSKDVSEFGDDYFAVPIHWVPQLEKIVTDKIKAKPIKDSSGKVITLNKFPYEQYLKDLEAGKVTSDTKTTGGRKAFGNVGNLGGLEKLFAK